MTHIFSVLFLFLLLSLFKFVSSELPLLFLLYTFEIWFLFNVFSVLSFVKLFIENFVKKNFYSILLSFVTTLIQYKLKKYFK